MARSTMCIMRTALQALLSLPTVLAKPSWWLPPFYTAIVGTMPLVITVGIALGLVAWMQLHGVLRQFQAMEALPSALALAVIWELGPVAAGLVAAARLGSGFGAELGSLKESEQISAAQVLGISIIARLVTPRALAAALALPLLAIVLDFTALATAALAEVLSGGMTFTAFQNASLQLIRWQDALPATLKTIIFGWLIGILGCSAGLKTGMGASAVGEAATRAVVRSTLAVLIADVILVKLIQWLVN